MLEITPDKRISSFALRKCGLEGRSWAGGVDVSLWQLEPLITRAGETEDGNSQFGSPFPGLEELLRGTVGAWSASAQPNLLGNHWRAAGTLPSNADQPDFQNVGPGQNCSQSG